MIILIANWVQVSGKINQNVVLTYNPSPNNPHYSPRYGMASVVMVINKHDFIIMIVT